MRWIVSIGLAVVVACGTDDTPEGGDDGAGSATTGDGATDDGPTDDGPTDDGPTDDGPTDDGPTDDGLTSGGEDPLFLHGCGLESPCPAWDNYCDFDGCAAPTEASDCVFEALAASWSGTPAYIDIVMAAEASPNTIYALGDGTAIVERPFRECTLREASWFENCVGNDQLDECYGPWSFWDWDSCEEVAPYCPGA